MNIVQCAQLLHDKGYLAAGDGNISMRQEAGFLITPSGKPKFLVEENELVTLNAEGSSLKGSPSSETSMHLAVYAKSPKAQAVVHAHPPHAIAYSIAHPDEELLPATCLSEVILAVGDIPIVPFARPGTEQMGRHLAPFLPKHRALILQRHGVLSWGETLLEAYMGVERIEHAAQVLCLVKSMGTLSHLPQEEIDYLRQKRQSMPDRIF